MTELSRIARTAIDILRGLGSWELAPARWALVSELLAILDAALSAGDLEALDEATADLALVGPVRIVRIGSGPVESAPEQLEDRANELIHRLLRLESQGDDAVGQETGADG